MEGFKFYVPFEYSMHNFFYQDIMSLNLVLVTVKISKSVSYRHLKWLQTCVQIMSMGICHLIHLTNAIYDSVDSILKLTKDIWDEHHVDTFAASRQFIDQRTPILSLLCGNQSDATNFASANQMERNLKSNFMRTTSTSLFSSGTSACWNLCRWSW